MDRGNMVIETLIFNNGYQNPLPLHFTVSLDGKKKGYLNTFALY